MTENRTIVIGTRKSRLAVRQALSIGAEIKKIAPLLQIQYKPIVTTGDMLLDAPLAKIGGKGLFIKELEKEMVNGTIDIAVHSLKDMPTSLPSDLCIAALTRRGDHRDAFISNTYKTFETLPAGAIVGTSSLRRAAQLLHCRRDITIKNLRGNILTRLSKLDAGDYDAIILAAAGLQRLGLDDRIRQYLPTALCLPAVGQGVLAVEARRGDDDLRRMLHRLNDPSTALTVTAERAFLRRIEGSCQVPVGVFGHISGRLFSLEAVIASADGAVLYRRKATCPVTADTERLAMNLADELLASGGREVLAGLGITAPCQGERP
ncbi:hydroxymethylbilane synthase [Megasphaera vaginalis (ex Bordigoni et al. 2020)]|uniref:hydroxymethylbilane synthase n=1 Tax=Megasphaera vaginalis (ex Bordigoni et al. 2020) TaxID=2045301 RepID=UPI000C7CF12A|nr:hydroxymethylbilane synthase [Megasphaera vaginalis (ex Bordigoni et al. 2020)]